MDMRIQSTRRVVLVDGVPCRIWEGETRTGVRCYVFVHRVACREEDDQREFANELGEQRSPTMVRGMWDGEPVHDLGAAVDADGG